MIDNNFSDMSLSWITNAQKSQLLKKQHFGIVKRGTNILVNLYDLLKFLLTILIAGEIV